MQDPMNAKSKIIVALDVSTVKEAVDLAEELAPHVGCFKVGLELISAVGGPTMAHHIHNLGGKVFYDGKFCDIPNTVGKATAAVAALGVRMFNLHASSSFDSMLAAAKNKGQSLALAVTVLTSMDDVDSQLDFGAPSRAKVLQFAREAKLAGLDGIVCSPQELVMLRKRPELRDLMMITPGIRSSGDPADDQKRTLTPAEAIKAGATALVIGRPITKPSKGTRVDAAKRIYDEIEAALES